MRTALRFLLVRVWVVSESGGLNASAAAGDRGGGDRSQLRHMVAGSAAEVFNWKQRSRSNAACRHRVGTPTTGRGTLSPVTLAPAGRSNLLTDMRSIAGGDPRVVSDDHNPYGVIILVEDSPRGGRKLGALLLI